jgi:uncharacterized membrane-anchored protein YitT (DUF2179 family)
VRHSLLDNALALAMGTLRVALGRVVYAKAGLVTGGTAGQALLLHYATGTPFGLLFFLVNLSFVRWLALALRALGRRFTVKSFVSVALLALRSEGLPRRIGIAAVAPPFAAALGGVLMGVGLLVLFRHHASLGGINVLVLYLQDRHGLHAGKVQMAVDGAIVLAALVLVPAWSIALSILGSVLLKLVLATNHRPDRHLRM